MRSEDRPPWDQWWSGVGERELRKTLGRWGFGSRYIDPVFSAVRSGATVVDLERLLPELRVRYGDPPDAEADGSCAVAVAVWWDGTGYSRRRFGAT